MGKSNRGASVLSLTDKEKLLWKFAGFFEAEGCISFHHRGPRKDGSIVLIPDVEWTQKTNLRTRDTYKELLVNLGFAN